jgi:hypothetical protein
VWFFATHWNLHRTVIGLFLLFDSGLRPARYRRQGLRSPMNPSIIAIVTSPTIASPMKIPCYPSHDRVDLWCVGLAAERDDFTHAKRLVGFLRGLR